MLKTTNLMFKDDKFNAINDKFNAFDEKSFDFSLFLIIMLLILLKICYGGK